MTLFSKSKVGLLCVFLGTVGASMTSIAGTVSSGILVDKYIGASYDNYSNKDYTPNNADANYNTNWMTVDKSDDGILTVKIDSNFIGYDSQFKLGDLFLMDGDNYKTATSCTDSFGQAGFRGCNENSYSAGTNQWEYAFDLELNLGDLNESNSESNYIDKNGTVRKIDTSGDVTDVSGLYQLDVNTSSQLKTSGGVRGWQIVDVKDTATEKGLGTWNTDVSNQLLTMTFDISGTSLMAADQIALRWAMSCANDIIEVVTNFTTPPGGSTSVPEPSTFLLMLLAGFGLFASKQKRNTKFKA